MWLTYRAVFCLLWFCFAQCQAMPAEVIIPMIDWETSFTDGIFNPEQFVGVQLHSAAMLAVATINDGRYFPDLLPRTLLKLNVTVDHFSSAAAIAHMIDFAEDGNSLVIGTPVSNIAISTATVGSVFGVAQLASAASTSQLSDTIKYPYFSRMTADTSQAAEIMRDAILFFSNLAGPGWTDVAIISTVNELTTDLSSKFIALVDDSEISVATYQQFLVGELDISIELIEIQNSGARVIIAMIFDDWENIVNAADKYGLVGESYVWFGAPTLPTLPFPPSNSTRGMIAPFEPFSSETPEAKIFLTEWADADPLLYPTAGPDTVPLSFAFPAYDMVIVIAKAIQTLGEEGFFEENKIISADQWAQAIRAVSFDGASGLVEFDAAGNRKANYGLYNYLPETGFQRIASYSQSDGIILEEDPIWYSNTTQIPDLDIREPFDYWSCDEAKKHHDESGKKVVLRTPGSDNVDDIDYSYHCDHFVDCQNFSDESTDCASNYQIIFIIFGVITGILILIAVALILFVIVFGLILNYRRLRKSSPEFLILILLSVIIGLSSVYAWFGKPHPVACAFQPWLLGLPTISMISALTVKIFRLVRIFRFPMERIKISNFELMFYWCITMVPAVLIVAVWTIVSTPTAAVMERDGTSHFVCTTGGFTGEPGGLVFFFVFVGYGSLVLFAGALVCLASRHVPNTFNESKLLTASIYNLGFLGIVIIPVFMVVNPINPFIAWILRSSAILYAFTATMFLQFVPILFDVFIVNKGKNQRTFKSTLKGSAGVTIPQSKESSSVVSGDSITRTGE